MKVLNLAVIISLSAALAHGGVRKITNPESFSRDAVHLTFETQLEGAESNDLYSAWGVTFAASDQRVLNLEIRIYCPGIVLAPCPFKFSVLRNRASGPLIVNFDFPLKRAGFFLAGPPSPDLQQATNPNTLATLEAFDNAGRTLGRVQQQGLSGGLHEPTFVGIEVIDPVGPSNAISKLTISLSNPAGAEEIEELDGLILDFLSRPTFTTFLAQVADGRFGGGLRALQSLVTLTNPSDNLGAKGTLSFFGSSGNALSFPFAGAEETAFEFIIGPSTSKTFVTSGASSLVRAGYARIDASVPVKATAIFRVVDLSAGDLLSEAGIGSDTGKVAASGSVFKSINGNIDTGIALVNTSAKQALVTIQAFDESRNLLARRVGLELGPRVHLARFVGQLMPELLSQDFSGSIQLRSSEPLAIVILRTKDGIGTSSLPVASTQK